jgi:hypothetical protein
MRTTAGAEMCRPTLLWRRRLKILAVGLVLALMVSATAFAAVEQSGELRVSVSTRISPYRLPRTGTAPITAHVAGHVSSTTGGVPPQLTSFVILVNRHAQIESAGLPTCTLGRLQPGTNARALKECGASLVGSGHFWASVVFSENRPYNTTGRLMIFAGRRGPEPVIFAHIYTTQPFPTSFVVTFAIHQIHKGPWGTELTASLPSALGSWGFVDRIKLNIGRTFHLPGGSERGYLEAGCPALSGTDTVPAFPLAHAELSFADGEQLSTTITRPCGVTRE